MFSKDLEAFRDSIKLKLPKFNGNVFIIDQKEDNAFQGVDDSIVNYIFLEQLVDETGNTFKANQNEQSGHSFESFIRIVFAFPDADIPKMCQLIYNLGSCAGSSFLLDIQSIETDKEIIYKVLYDDELKNDNFSLIMAHFKISKVLQNSRCTESLIACSGDACK